MMNRHSRLRSEIRDATAKRFPHAKNQLFMPGSFFNQLVIYIHFNRVLIVRISSPPQFDLFSFLPIGPSVFESHTSPRVL